VFLFGEKRGRKRGEEKSGRKLFIFYFLFYDGMVQERDLRRNWED
jgi:hypothetical protein